MSIYEYVGNTHVHTRYSDGEAVHAQIAQAAAEARLNFVIATDHNVWVDGCEGYYNAGEYTGGGYTGGEHTGKVLLLVGEEVHDVRRLPPVNHLLAYNAEAELAPLASDPQGLIDEVNQRGGFSFLAHPYEYPSAISPDLNAIPWADWGVTGYTGLEIWNYMSEFKSLLRNKVATIFYAYFPALGLRGPFRATLRQWDRLLSQGHRIAAIGGADAHGTLFSLGPLRRAVFPYAYLFRCVNTHILTERPLNGRLEHDKPLVYDALRAGHTWVGYDLLAPTAGFRFNAHSINTKATVGDELRRTGATVFEVQTPYAGDIRLILDGSGVPTAVVARASGRALKYTTAQPGTYRVEVYRTYRLGRRGWIFSSPIYVV
ncbi:MAG TPA: CehA/McbA family metallohydrolase [Anaerolineae bacterium]|nr:CehA/McbA family metallohydrolase [Anaerolineae bacterium]